MKKYIAYYRVSTKMQGESGLGLEAQERAVSSFLATNEGTLLSSFQDIESGSHNDRKGLQNALKQCKFTGATLLIARLDRLSRNAGFLLSLRDSEIDFIACDLPLANRFTVGIYSLLAEEEKRLISQRTKSALQSAKARGVKLGGLREGAFGGNSELGVKALKKQADAFAQEVFPFIEPLVGQGLSLNAIAKELNSQNIKTSRGGIWTAKAVQRVIARMEGIR